MSRVRLYNVGSKYIESRWNPNYNFVVKHDKNVGSSIDDFWSEGGKHMICDDIFLASFKPITYSWGWTVADKVKFFPIGSCR